MRDSDRRTRGTKPSVQAGTLDQALLNGHQLLGSHPAAAAIQARTILRSDSKHLGALRLLVRALRLLGEDAEADVCESVAISTTRDGLIREGRARGGNPEQFLRETMASDATDAAIPLLLGEHLASQGSFTEAQAQIERAMTLAPFHVPTRLSLAGLHLTQKRLPDGLQLVDELLAERPDDLTAGRLRAILLTEIGDYDAAATAFEGLAASHPDHIALSIGLGDAYRALGRKSDAIIAYRRAIAVDPLMGRSWWSLATLDATAIDDDDIAAMEKALAARAADADNRYHLHFALGTVLDKRARYGDAFRHLAMGNRICRDMVVYDAATVTEEVARTEALHDRRFFKQRAGGGAPARDPIFIVGMPRSGSTLVEQMLASHPLIEGTAELPLIPILIQTMMGERGADRETSYRTILADLSDDERRRWGEEYLARAAAHRKTDRPYFIDKLPHNWADIGFIQLILPNATIIDVRRAPMDCCFSNFKLLFAQGHPSSSSLVDMASYYRDYVRLMRHFDHALPGRIHRVIYEHLVADPRRTVGELLDHMGLAFDPACLDFHRTSRTVATASSEQVRRPMNRDGLNVWHPYAALLGALETELGELQHRYAD